MGNSACCTKQSEYGDIPDTAERLSDEDAFELNRLRIYNSKRNERNNQIAARVIDPTKSLSVKIGDINGGVCTYEKEFYSKDINKNVVLVIEVLSKLEIDCSDLEVNFEREKVDLKRYGYECIRNFLIVNDGDVEITIECIIKDIKWRTKFIPIEQKEIFKIVNSRKAVLTSNEDDMKVCLLISPNAILKDGTTYDISINDYVKYVIYCFENLDKKLIKKGYEPRYTISIDFESPKISNGERISKANMINFDLVQSIYTLIVDHYPMKATHIIVVNAKMKHISALSYLKIRCIPALPQKIWKGNKTKEISWIEFEELKDSFC